MPEQNEDLALVLEAKDICEEEITVPEWGGVRLLLKGLTIEEVQRIQKHGRDREGAVDVARSNAMSIIEGAYHPRTGRKFFEAAHLDALKRKNASTIERVANRIAELSKTNPSALADAEKNSLAGSESSSPSPRSSDTAL